MSARGVPQHADVAVALGLRRGLGILPYADVVIAQRVFTIAQQLVRAVSLPSDQRLHLPRELEKFGLPAVRNLERHGRD
jgi:hypothetical protein